MKLFDWLAGKAAKREPTEMEGRYTAASIRLGEEHSAISATAINQVDFNRVARAIQGSIWNASSIIATECASHPLRLYRKAGAGKQVGKAVAVTERQQAWLKGRRSGMRPTAKMVSMANAAGDVQEVTEHPALQLLADPDPMTTASDFLTMLFWYRETAGKAYVWTGQPTKAGPSGLYLLHPQFTQPVLNRKNMVSAYRYGRETTSILEVPADQVIFSPYQRDPFRPWEGISWLHSVEHYADAENAALVTEVQRWKNAGQPGFILKVPMTYTDQQMKQAEAALRSKGGPFAAGRALIIREAELVQSAAKTNEMGYVAGLEQSERAIYRAAGIPEAIWKLNDSNLAGAKLGERLLTRACMKRMCRVAEDLTAYLLPMFGEEPGQMWFAYEDPDLEDQQIEASVMSQAFAAGVVDADEYRKVLYLPPRAVRQAQQAATTAMAEAEAEQEGLDIEAPEAGANANGEAAGELPEPEGETEAPSIDIEAPGEPGAEAEAEGEEEHMPAITTEQLTALQQIITDVLTGGLPADSARALASVAFPGIMPEQLDAIFAPLAQRVVLGEQAKSGKRKARVPDTTGADQPSEATGSGSPVSGTGGQGQPEEQGSAGEPGSAADKEACGCGDEGPELITKELPEFTAPAEARAEAEQALAWRAEFNRGGTMVGVARARDIMNGRVLSPDTIQRIVSYFARHEADSQAEGWREGEEGYPSAGRIAWGLWGGDPMRQYAEQAAALIDAEEEAAAEAEAEAAADTEEKAEAAAAEQTPATEAEACRPGEAEACTPKLEKAALVGRFDWAGKCGCGTSHRRKADSSAEAIQRMMEKLVARWGKDQMREVLDSLKPDGTFDVSLFNQAKLRELLQDTIAQAFADGSTAFFNAQGVTGEALTGDAALKYVQRYNFDLVQGITDTMAEQLRTAIGKELEAGTTVNQMSQRLADEVDGISLQRAETIARTETSRAIQHGSMAQAEELGYQSKTWLLSGNYCGLCEGASRLLKGKKTKLTDPFFSAGQMIQGTDGVLYTLSRPVMVASDIHPNCGCTTIEEFDA